MRTRAAVLLAAALLAGCNKRETGGGSAAAPARVDVRAATALPAAAPRIAYRYRYEFRVPSADVGKVQQRHVALCDALGPRCQIVAMDRRADAQGDASGTLSLRVAADAARRFGAQLGIAVADARGETADSSIGGEDVSKQIVDVAARIRARETLVSRLSTLLATRGGDIEAMYRAEKAVNDAQEELDAARSWSAELDQRVAMSSFEIGYEGTGGSGILAPAADAYRAMGGMLGGSIGALLTLLAVLAPWAIVALGIGGAIRWAKRRRRPITG